MYYFVLKRLYRCVSSCDKRHCLCVGWVSLGVTDLSIIVSVGVTDRSIIAPDSDHCLCVSKVLLTSCYLTLTIVCVLTRCYLH